MKNITILLVGAITFIILVSLVIANSSSVSLTAEEKQALTDNGISKISVSDMACDNVNCYFALSYKTLDGVKVETKNIPLKVCSERAINDECVTYKTFSDAELLDIRDKMINFYVKEKAQSFIAAKPQAPVDNGVPVTRVTGGDVSI